MRRFIALVGLFAVACSPAGSGQDSTDSGSTSTSNGSGDGDGDGDGDGECIEEGADCSGVLVEPCCPGAECRGSFGLETCEACVDVGGTCAANSACCGSAHCVGGACGPCRQNGQTCSVDSECCYGGMCEDGTCNALECSVRPEPIAETGVPSDPAMSMCDPGLQDCPEGEKCTAYATDPDGCCVDANKCVIDCGDKKLGEACTRWYDNDNCEKGLFCLLDPSGAVGEGTCMAFCDLNDVQSCEKAGLADGVCVAYSDGVIPLCRPPCDPLGDDCDESEGCYPYISSFVCMFPSPEEGKGNDGDGCFGPPSCNPGLDCFEGQQQNGCNDDACCTPFCDCTGDGSECTDPMEACVCYFTMGQAPEGLEHVGVCSLP